jgi:hypothetical protein
MDRLASVVGLSRQADRSVERVAAAAGAGWTAGARR